MSSSAAVSPADPGTARPAPAHRRAWVALDRPRLWRATAAAAALLLLAALVVAAQGSVAVIDRAPARAAAVPPWAAWCSRGEVRLDRRRLAYCARVNGLVLSSTRGPGPRESHVAVLGGFHLTLVRLPDGAPTPSAGSRVTAVGPLVRARDGQREVQAFLWRS